MNRSDFLLIGIYKSQKGYTVKEYTRLPRQSMATSETKEQATKRLRLQYERLSKKDKDESHEHYQHLAEVAGVDFWLIICDNIAFKNSCEVNGWK